MKYDASRKLPFIRLPEHEFSFAAFNNAVQQEAEPRRFLYLHGPAGVGKTALIDFLLRQLPADRFPHVTNISASVFSEHYLDAFNSNMLPEFFELFRHCDVLVCEDIASLRRKHATQDALITAIDSVIAKGGLVIASANRSPGSLSEFSTRLVSRCLSAAVCHLKLPSAASCLTLLNEFNTFHQLQLNDECLADIADRYRMSPRMLFAALIQLAANPNSTLSISQTLDSLTETNRYSIEQICFAVTRHFGVSIQDLRSPSRAARFAIPRHCFVYLTRKLSTSSFRQIASFLNRSNHSAIAHSVRRFDELLSNEPELQSRLNEILSALDVPLVVQ